MTAKKEPYDQISLLEFFQRFPDEDACWAELVRLRWPKGKNCPDCGNGMGLVKTRRVFQCNPCRKQVSATAGTMFHQSHIPLQKWFWAIFLMATSSKGISMLNLKKHLGIKSYQAVWLMGHKIRSAMGQREKLYQLKGQVQVDEFSVGRQNYDERREIREDRRGHFLIGVQESASTGAPRFVTFEQLAASFKENILPALEKRIAKGSRLKSDGAGAFKEAEKHGFKVDQVSFTKDPEKAKEHLKGVYWLQSNLKRGLVSTYHGCFPKYRHAYLAEFAYRFNRRHWPRQAFNRLLVACIQGQRVTLKGLRNP